MIIRFIHTADIHFGMENYGHVDEKTGLNSRLIDFQRAFYFTVKKAIEYNVDCFIFAGDAYKNSHPTPTHQRILLQCFSKLIEAKIPIVIIVGNHDYPGNESKAHALDIFNFFEQEGCYLFDKPGSKKIITKNGPLNIIGVPWPSKKHYNNDFLFNNESNNSLVEDVKNFIQQSINTINTNEPVVLVGHMTVEGGLFSGSERPVSIGKDPIFSIYDLKADFFDYIALGHLHRFQDLGTHTTCPVVYSGSPEKIDFGEVDDEKSCCLVTIEVCDNKKKSSYKTIKTPTRPLYEIILDETDEHMNEKLYMSSIQTLPLQHAIIKIRYIYKNEKQNVYTHLVEYVNKTCWFFVGIQYQNNHEHVRSTYEIAQRMATMTDLIMEYADKHEIHKKYKNHYFEIIKKYDL
jgi:exonuclease SbcD